MMKLTLLLLLIVLFFNIDAFSLPRFALKSGSACIDCHVNPTGGEMRNDRGWNMSRKGLTMTSPREDFEMSNHLSENITLGLDFRGQVLGRLDSVKKQLDFHRMSASIYTNVALSDEMNIYARYDFIQQFWEGYGVFHVLPNNSYIKGGTFVPNFGIRLDDHTAYTRGGDMGLLFGGIPGLIYTPTYSESGVEAGFYISDFGLLTLSAGSPNLRPFNSDPTYTASLNVGHELSEDFHLMAGGSAANFKNRTAVGMTNIWLYGGFAGIGVGPFTLLAEYDMANDYAGTDVKTGVMMIEGSLRVSRGVEAVVRYDRLDPDNTVTDDERSRIVIGADIFPYSFVEIKPQFRIQMEEPAIENNSFVLQIHLFY